ncbi:MAG: DUF2341 domain-containing protein [Candidatus Omnitrophica bacterium]|nr:DUF2341 domain-containing protein [Candidatus Omnitrophota bacterium]
MLRNTKKVNNIDFPNNLLKFCLTFLFFIGPLIIFTSFAQADVPVFMAYSQASATSGGTINVTKPSGTVQGDLLIASYVSDDIYTLTAPSGWTLIQGGYSNPVDNTPSFGVWYKIADASEPTSYTFSSGGNDDQYVAILRYQGHDPAAPINNSAIAYSTGSNAPTAPSINTTREECVILRVFGADDDDTPYNVPAGYSERYNGKSTASNSSCGGAGADTTQALPGATGTAAFSMNAIEEWMAVTIAIAPPPKPNVNITVTPNQTKAQNSGGLEFKLVFDQVMNTSIAPVVSYDPAGVLGAQSCTGGTWSTTTLTNDTYKVYNDNPITDSTGDGTATISVSAAKSAAGAIMNPDTNDTFLIDATVPINPTQPCSAWNSSSKINSIANDTWQEADNTPYFEWSGATDTGGTGVNGYSVYWGNDAYGEPALIQEQSASNYNVSSGTADGVYYLRVRTFDIIGNYSQSVTLFTFRYDAGVPLNPDIPCAAWQSNLKVNPISNNTWQQADDTPYFEWTGANDSGGSGISGYSVYWGTDINGAPGVSQEQGNADYEISTPTGDGTYYLRIRTFDNLNHYSAPITLFTFRYDATAPLNPTVPCNAWDSSSKNTVISDNTAQGIDSSPYFEWSGADDGSGQGVSGYSVYWGIDPEGEPATAQEQSAANYNIVSAVSEGTYYLRIRTFDALGHYSDAVTLFTFILDQTKPTVSVGVLPDPSGHRAPGELGFTLLFSESMDMGTDPIVSYDPSGATGVQNASLNGAWSTTNNPNDTYTVYNSNAINSATGEGTATISISMAKDIAGNTMLADTNDVFSINTAIDHFVIEHDGSGLINIPETITITAKNITNCTVNDFTGQITLSTLNETKQITWALVSGNGTFVDNGLGNDSATYTFNAADNGVVVLQLTCSAANNLDIEATDGTHSDDDTEGTLVISTTALGWFVIEHDNAAVAGVKEDIKVTAKDTNGLTKTDYVGTVILDTTGTPTTISWTISTGLGTFSEGGASVDTAQYTFNPNDNGVAIFTIKDTKAETLNISVDDAGKTDNNLEGNLVIAPGALNHFIVSHDAQAIAGIADSVTIRAYDIYNNIKTDYVGTMTVDTNGTDSAISWAKISGNGIFTDGGPSADTATYGFVSADAGVVVLSITDTKKETIDIDASAEGKTDTDSEGTMVISAAAIDYFLISHDTAGSAGVAEQVTVLAKDSYGNTKTDYTGTITLDTNGTAAAISWAKAVGNGIFTDNGPSVDTATYVFDLTDNGIAVFSIIDSTAESINISVSGDAKTDNNTEGNLVIGPAVIWSFRVTHDGAGNAGLAETVTITALNSIGQIKTDYTGTITIDTNGTATAISWTKLIGNGTFNDGGVAVDTAVYTFSALDNGVVTLAITDNAVESIDIDVSGSGKTDDDSEGLMNIDTALLAYFRIAHDGIAVAGINENITITAKDTLGQTKTDYTGTIYIDTDGTANTITWTKISGAGGFVDDGAAADTCAYTFSAADNGVVVLGMSDTFTETINISVSGSASDDNTEGLLQVRPGTLSKFIISHDNNAFTGIPEHITIAAYDGFNNIKTDYTGSIIVDTNGTATTISWAKYQGAGTFVDGGASVDTATYTYNSADTGIVTLDMTDMTAETINISVSGGGSVDDNTEGNLVITQFLLGNWTYNKEVTIDRTKVMAALTDFPVLISIVDTALRDNARSDGFDIVFTASDKNTKLDHEIESFDKATGTLVAWVKIPSLLASADTKIYMYYGNPAASDQQNKSGVWDSSYKGVWHLNNDPSITAPQVKDSTSNNNAMTSYGTMTNTDLVYAKVGKGIDFDGSNDYFKKTSPVGVGTPGDYTVSAWFKYTSSPANYGTIYNHNNYSPQFGFYNQSVAMVYHSSLITSSGTATHNDNQWHKVDYRRVGSTVYFYVDGVLHGTGSHTRTFPTATSALIGWSNYSNEYWLGQLDEVRYSTTARSPEWIATEYNNQNSPATFINVGLAATATANPVITDTVPVGQTGNLILNVSVTNNEGSVLTINSITLNNVGTASDAEITAVKLYYDSNNSLDYTPGVDTQVGNSGFSSGTKMFSGFNINISAGATQYLFAVVDVASACASGKILDVSIPINGITFSNGKKLASAVLNSNGTRQTYIGLNHFVINHDGAAIAGLDEHITITAKDAYGNTKTDYTGTITVDTDGTAESISWSKYAGNGVFTDGGSSLDTATYTFALSDGGVVVLNISNQIAQTINISVNGDAKSDDNTEPDLSFSAGLVDKFILNHDQAAIAGQGETITIIVKDSFGNTVTNYSGQITLGTDGSAADISWTLNSGSGIFLNNGAGAGTAMYTFDPSDSGTASFEIMDNKAETINIIAVGDGKYDDNSEGALVVAPGELHHFVISHDQSANAGSAEVISITALDSLNNIKTNYTGTVTLDTTGTATKITWALNAGNGIFIDGGGSLDTATYTFNALDNGIAVFNLTDTKAEIINISVVAGSITDNDTEGNMIVGPGEIDYFLISHDRIATTDVSEQIMITAYDAFANIKNDYTGTIGLDTTGTVTTITWTLISGEGIFNDSGPSDDTASYTFTADDSGVVIVSIINYTAESVNISVTGDGKTDNNLEGNLVFVSSGIDHFLIVHDNNAIAGIAESISIYAKNANGDTLTSYGGQITIDTTGTPGTISWALQSGTGDFTDSGAADDTCSYIYDDADLGVVVLTMIDSTEETINISVFGEAKTDNNTEGNLVINPAGLHHFSITHDNNAIAGIGETVTIQAKDANNNTLNTYAGQINLDTTGTATTVTWAKISGNGSFSDGGALVDTATYSYVAGDSGTCVLSITDTKVESLNISVAGGGKTDDDKEGLLTIGAGAIDHFTISHDGIAVAGVADNVTITAYDAYGNIKTNYTGQITLDTNGTATTITWAKAAGLGTFIEGGAAVDTATYTFLAADNGQCILKITDTKSESLNISVIGDGKSDNDSEGNLIVSPTSLQYFMVSHDTNAEAGVAENITITAYDLYSNIKDNYTGTITLDTNGTATTISWSKVTGNGVFTDGGAAVDTATYTYTDSDKGIVVLSINDTKKENIDIDVFGGGKTDTDTEGILVIAPTSINHFVITHDGNAEAGIAENITVKAYDIYSNLKDNYMGTIGLNTNGTETTITWAKITGNGVFVDGGAAVDTASYTYADSDDGIAVFSITDTKKEVINITISGDGKSDTNTEGDLTVGASAINYFTIFHDGSGVVGLGESIAIYAKDTWGNIKDNYIGQITVDTNGTATAIAWTLSAGVGVFVDGGAAADTATYTFSDADDGLVVLSLNNSVAETINISVSGDGKTDDNTEGNLIINPVGGLNTGYLSPTANSGNFTSPANAYANDTSRATSSNGQSQQYSNYGINIPAGSTILGIEVQMDAYASTTTGLIQGLVELSWNGGTNFTSTGKITPDMITSEVTYILGGPTDIWGRTWTVADLTNANFRLRINASTPGTTSYLYLDWIPVRVYYDLPPDAIANPVSTNSVSAGASNILSLDITVTNSASQNRIINSLTINNTGTLSDTEIASLKLYYDSNNSGDYTVNVDNQVGSGVFNSASKTFTGLIITVPPSGSADLFVVCQIAQTVNDADTLDIQIPSNGISFANGVQIEDTALNSAGIIPVSLVLNHFVIVHDQAAVTGIPEQVRITAHDVYGNIKTAYTGTITLDTNGTATAITWAKVTGNGVFTDGGAAVDTATYIFNATDNGTALFSIVDNKAETINISVSGNAKIDDNTEGNLVISSGAIDHFQISHDSAAVAGVPENIIITAKDVFNNTVANYTGQIILDTNGTAAGISWELFSGFGVFADGGQGVDTATYTFNSSDNSTVTFTLTATVAETLNIAVTGDGKADDNTEANLIVSAAGLNHFLINHDGAAQAGVAETITITAKDQYGNTKKNYTEQISLDTNGTASTIVWAKISGNGTFVDGGLSVDTATYTYNLADNGVVILSLKDTNLESLNISVSGSGKTDNDSEGLLNVGPGIINHFSIIHDGFGLQNQAEEIIIKAYDAYNNIKTDYTGSIIVDTNGTANAITWALNAGSGVFNDNGASVDTATYTFNLSDNGQVILSLTDTVSEIINISISGDTKTDDDNEGVLEIVAAGFHHFKITHDGNAIAGIAEQIMVTAKDASDVTITNYAGTITLDTNGTATEISWALQSGTGAFNDNGLTVDTATYTFNLSDNGTAVFTITNTQIQTINISVSGSGKTDDNTEGNLVFNPPGLKHFRITHDGSAIAGVVENIIITARDANSNPVVNYTGSITLDTNGTSGTIAWSKISGNGTFTDGGAAVDTATYSFAAADNGTVTLGIVNTKAELFNVSVIGDAKTDDNLEGDITVIANALNKFIIVHDASAQAGIAENIIITAKDAYANTIINYTGTINLDTNGNATTISWAKVTGSGVLNDGGALVDTADYTFGLADNGVVVLSITDTTVENLNISVASDGKSDDDTEGILIVGAGALDKFIVSHDGSGYAGIGELITVKAYDIYANIKTNYSGTITVDTNGTMNAISWSLNSGLGVFTDGGAAVDTATYTFVAGDNGLVVLMLIDTAAESIDIDISGSGKFDDDSEGNMLVSPSGLHHFLIEHDASAMAGIAESINIYAKDYYNNTQNDYTGTITLDTTGTATTITWSNISGNGMFNDNGASLDTAAYTFILADNGLVSFSLNDTTAEILNISVSGDGKFDDDTEGGLTVSPNVLNYFSISHDGSAVQSIGEEIMVTAKDQYGNIKTDYIGTIILDTDGDVNNISWELKNGAGFFTDGGSGVDTAMYTFALQDNGEAFFNITDNTAQTIDIDVNDGSIIDDDTEGALVVQASSLSVDITANTLSSGYISQTVTDKLILDLTLTNNNVLAADTIQSLTINNSGTIPDSQISAIKLFYDSNNSGEFEPGIDAQIGTKVFSGGAAVFNDIDVLIPIAGTEELYATVDLSGTVTNGASVDISVPINGISFEFSPTAEDSILNSTGSYIVDSVGPGNVSGLATNSHNNAISTWSDPQSKDNTVSVTWSPAIDADSGLDGYSLLWDTNPTTIPDTIKDIEQTQNSNTSPALVNGNTHYVHIRSVDNVGNWASTAVHLGPFYIDTQVPTPVSVYQISEYAGGDYLSVSGNTIYYSGLAYSAFRVYLAASDAASGLKEALFPTTTSSGGTDTTEDVGAYQYLYTYEIAAPATSFNNVNAVVYDNAGNSINVPFSVVLDSTAPNFVTTLTSSSHTQGVPSINNDITFTWSDVSDTQSGVAGYSIIVNTNPTTIPPQYLNVDQGQGTYTANDRASGSYYGHIRSVDNVGNWSSTVTHAGPYIIGRGNLNAAITSSKNIVSTDQQFSITMTVDNSGSSAVNDVDPSTLTVSTTGAATATTSSNPAAQDIAAAGQKQFQWVYTAGANPGTISFKGYAQGTDTDGIIKSSVISSNDITVEQKANLSLSVSAAPSTVNTNENITIKVTVSNSGQADAVNVALLLTPSGSANPIIDSGPSPATSTIKGGRSKEFTFIAHGAGAGVANFAAYISQGTDENSNLLLLAIQAQDSVTVQSPPFYELTSSISATPVSVQPAETITIIMNVQNTGGSILTNITPSSLAVGGTSSDAIYATGPTPANVSTLAAGAAQQFSWTYTAGSTLGSINFTGNANSTEIGSSATASSDITILTEAAVLTSAIAATPASLLTNATITVTMSVTNTANSGGATAENVIPSILTIGGSSGEANLLTGPSPSSANIAPQAQQNFVWTYKAGITPGTVNFTGNASGTDSSDSSDVSSAANASANVSISTLNADWIYPTGANVLGPIRSIPIAYWGMENKIYIGSDDNNLYILNGDTHELDSSFTTSGKIRGLPYPSTDIDGADLKDIVYFGTVGKTVYGLWADNTLRWNRVMGEALTTTVLYDYVSGVYFGTTANNIYCIDAADGTDFWGAPAAVGGAIESSPAMIYVPTLDYDEIYFGASDGKVYGFKAIDGTGARTFDTGFGAEGAIKTAPTITLQNPSVGSSRRLMVFGTANGKFYAVNTANLSSAPADTGWSVNPISVGGAVYSAPWFDTGSRYVFFGSQDGKLYAVSIADGSMKPNFPVDVGSPIDSWPLVENGIVYFGADNGKFYAVDVVTGQIVPGWPYDTGDAIKGGAALHLIYNTDTWDVEETYVIVGSDSGKVYSFRAVR